MDLLLSSRAGAGRIRLWGLQLMIGLLLLVLVAVVNTNAAFGRSYDPTHASTTLALASSASFPRLLGAPAFSGRGSRFLVAAEDTLQLPADFRPIAGGAPMLGEGGVQVTSRTLLRDTGQGFRIDVENPAPGVRPGQLHLQDAAGGKYLYDFEAGQFQGLPPGLARQVANDPAVAGAIAKGRDYLNVP